MPKIPMITNEFVNDNLGEGSSEWFKAKISRDIRRDGTVFIFKTYDATPRATYKYYTHPPEHTFYGIYNSQDQRIGRMEKPFIWKPREEELFYCVNMHSLCEEEAIVTLVFGSLHRDSGNVWRADDKRQYRYWYRLSEAWDTETIIMNEGERVGEEKTAQLRF